MVLPACIVHQRFKLRSYRILAQKKQWYCEVRLTEIYGIIVLGIVLCYNLLLELENCRLVLMYGRWKLSM